MKQLFFINIFLFFIASCGLFKDNPCQGLSYTSPSMYVTDGGKIYISYYVKDRFTEEDDSGTCPDNTLNYNLVLASSADNGLTWTRKTVELEVLADNTKDIYSQSIVINSSSYIFVTYVNNEGKFICAISKDDGLSFPSKVELDNSGIVNSYSIATDSNGNVYVVYNTDKLILKKYSAGTDAWSSAITIDSNSGVGSAPSIIVSGNGRLFISYYNRASSGNSAGLKLARSYDAGTTWTIKNIKNADGKASGSFSWINSDTDNYLYVAFYDAQGFTNAGSSWYENDNGILRVAKSLDYGNSWTTTAVTSTEYTGKNPSIVPGMAGNYICVVYGHNAIDEDNKILFSYSQDGNHSYSTASTIDSKLVENTNITDLNYINISLRERLGILYLSYIVLNEDGTSNLKFASSENSGLTWSKVNVY